jgi:hypothetical protein
MGRLSLLLVVALCAQQLYADDAVKNPFPAEWHGHWKGTLVISPARGKEQQAPMEILIRPIAKPEVKPDAKTEGESYDFHIIYGAGEKKQTRPYVLKPDPKTPGRFTVDEKNGIEIDGRLVNGTFYCPFQVGESINDTRYRLEGDTLVFELIVIDLKSAKTTKLQQKGGEGFEVKSYVPPVVQKAILKKEPFLRKE